MLHSQEMGKLWVPAENRVFASSGKKKFPYQIHCTIPALLFHRCPGGFNIELREIQCIETLLTCPPQNDMSDKV